MFSSLCFLFVFGFIPSFFVICFFFFFARIRKSGKEKEAERWKYEAMLERQMRMKKWAGKRKKKDHRACGGSAWQTLRSWDKIGVSFLDQCAMPTRALHNTIYVYILVHVNRAIKSRSYLAYTYSLFIMYVLWYQKCIHPCIYVSSANNIYLYTRVFIRALYISDVITWRYCKIIYGSYVSHFGEHTSPLIYYYPNYYQGEINFF